jgi:hypothetical protein
MKILSYVHLRFVRWLIPLAMVLAGLLLLSCTPTPSPALNQESETVPAVREAERLRTQEPPAAAEVRELRAQELAAQQAVAQAQATGDAALAASQRRLADELGRVRAAAERRAKDQRQELAALASDADRRATRERAERDQRTLAAQQAVDTRRAHEQRLRDQRLAGWGLALAVAAGIALRLLGIPPLISGGLPVAVGAGCLTIAAWSAVPWLAPLLGVLLAGSLVIAMAMLARHLISEWSDYAHRLAEVHPNGKVLADELSRARQPRWVRWFVDRLLARHGAPSVPLPLTAAAAGA